MNTTITDRERRHILVDALLWYGGEKQAHKAMEEMAELVVAIMHYYQGRETREDVVTEIADVTIMLQQLQIHFGAAAVNREIDAKLCRLAERIAREKDASDRTQE